MHTYIHTELWRREMTYFCFVYDFQALPIPSVIIAMHLATEVQKSNVNISDSLIIPNGRKDDDNRHWPEDWLNEGLKPFVVLFHFTERIHGEDIFSFWYKYPLNQWTCNNRLVPNRKRSYIKAVYCHTAYLTYMQSTS